MRTLDNSGKDTQNLPGLFMVWICSHCPQEVRILSEKDAETQQHWIIKRLSIFVHKNEIEYCLHWDYTQKIFEILRVDSMGGYILRMPIADVHITPENAAEKLDTYLIFS